MNESLTTSEAGGRADLFFDRKPMLTDWAGVLANAGQLVPADIMSDLKVLEPIDPTNIHVEHTNWVLQQKLRIALRAQQGLPLVNTTKCMTCNVNFGDPAYNDEGTHLVESTDGACLSCMEWDRQMHNAYWGSRGSCEFVRATYDPFTRNWGLLIYISRAYDDELMFWAAQGWKNHREAELALYPLCLFVGWLSKTTLGEADYDIRQFLEEDQLLRPEGPLTPSQFRAYLHATISKYIEEPDTLIRNRVSWALIDYESSIRH